jgi:uncharacterized repeat protein (TIGR03843 family)
VASNQIHESLETALQSGKIELKGQFMLGSNYTFLVSVRLEADEFPAVYKPQRGEQPLWDFPENSLAGREVAAWLVSEALGWGIVPLTVLRENGPYGPGSLQQFIEYDPEYHYFSFSEADRARLRTVSLFDHLTNNADRKGSHVIIEKGTGHLFAIDHGLCFNAEDKLRTVIWDFAREPIPEDLLAGLEKLRADLATGQLRSALAALLEPDEVAALDARAAALLRSKTYPTQPGGRRAFPYPPL